MRPHTFLVVLLAACGGSPEPVIVTPDPPPARDPQTVEAEPPPHEDHARELLAADTAAPDFLVADQNGTRRALSEHRGQHVVLYFYPRDATPGCTAEACAFRDAWDRLEAAGAVVLGVSTDDVDSHHAFAEEHELPFPLLSDPDETVLEAYGVSCRGGAAQRVTFLIDASGRIARVFPEVDPGVHADEVLAALAELGEPGPMRANIVAAVGAEDRSERDRALDEGRRPVETFAFFGIERGMKVAELFAGTGYTAEILARIVGRRGRVYGQNNPWVLERFAEEPWSARLRTPPMRPVQRVDRELDDPLPPNARNLDAVLFILAYHDSVWMEADRAAMNRAIFAALKPGGVYGIIDHAAAEGRGVEDVQTLHRIERATVVQEVEAAGFVLDEEALFLRNPDDGHDWSASPGAAGERRGTSDRFVLRFLKPAD